MHYPFENDVKMYGTQANTLARPQHSMFENDVKMYGTQAIPIKFTTTFAFENDVKMYGTQAGSHRSLRHSSLRMM